MRKRLYEIIHPAQPGDVPSKIFDIILVLFITVSSALTVAETFSVKYDIAELFVHLEAFFAIVFTIEYFCRIIVADYRYPNNGPILSRLHYILSPFGLIDLFSILPFYLSFVIPGNMFILRILRLIRMMRVFRLGRYADGLAAIGRTFVAKRYELISSILVISLLMVMSSVLMYCFENPAQPDKFGNALQGLWWALNTLTTVGYGDVYPITPAGQILSCVVSVLGIGLIAVPTGIISAGFVEQSHAARQEEALGQDMEQANSQLDRIEAQLIQMNAMDEKLSHIEEKLASIESRETKERDEE